MPRNKRDILKRRMGYAIVQIQKAMENIYIVREEFEGVHDEYVKLSKAAADGLSLSLSMLESFCVHAWGKTPELIEKWTQTGEDWYRARMKGNDFTHILCIGCQEPLPRQDLEKVEGDDGEYTYYRCPTCTTPLLIIQDETDG